MTAFPDDTDALVEQAAAGDDRAAEALLDRHRRALRRMIAVRLDARIAGRVDPSDVVQDLLLVAHQRIDDYLRNPAVPFHVWLRKLAEQRLVDLYRLHLRAQRRTVTKETPLFELSDQSAMSLMEQLSAEQASPSAALHRKEAVRLVHATLRQLSVADQEILIMRHLEELSVKEVAEVLNIAQGTVKSRHFRALEKLRTLLEEASHEA